MATGQQQLYELADEAIVAALDRVIAALENPAPMYERMGGFMERAVQARFDSKTAPDGSAWAPLSPTTIAIYGSDWFKALNPEFKDGIPGTLLERTRLLRESVSYNFGEDFLEVGTSRKVGAWQIGLLHETGTRKMPARRLLTKNPDTGELGDADAAGLLRIIDGFISGALAG
jgi:phage virion morphogenesis protein